MLEKFRLEVVRSFSARFIKSKIPKMRDQFIRFRWNEVQAGWKKKTRKSAYNEPKWALTQMLLISPKLEFVKYNASAYILLLLCVSNNCVMTEPPHMYYFIRRNWHTIAITGIAQFNLRLVWVYFYSMFHLLPLALSLVRSHRLVRRVFAHFHHHLHFGGANL